MERITDREVTTPQDAAPMKIMIFCDDPSYFSQEKVLTAPSGTVFEIRETEPDIDLFPKPQHGNHFVTVNRIRDAANAWTGWFNWIVYL